MNILYIANFGRLYGANRSMLDMISIIRQKHTVYVVSPEWGELVHALRKQHITYAVVSYYPAIYGPGEKRWNAAKTAANLSAIRQLIQLIKIWNIDLVHTNSITHDIGAISALLTNVPHIWHIREMLKAHYKNEFVNAKLQRFLMRTSAGIVCISNAVRRYYQTYGGHPYVLHDGLQCDQYLLDREGRYFPEYELRILVCGVIFKKKYQLEAVKAVHRLVEEGVPVSLKIVGEVTDPNYFHQIKEYIVKHDLKSQITLLPYQENMNNIRRETDVALMCSRNEGLGRVTVEGMLSSCLVIGAKDGGTAEIIQDGKTGFLYRPGDIGQLVSILKRVEKNRLSMIPIIEAGRRYAEKHFDLENYGKQLNCIYGKAVTKKAN